MQRNKLLLLLVLLMTAATGAWATDVYVVGNGNSDGNWLNGVAWDPGSAGNKMTEQNGVYSITFTNVAANPESPFQFKFAINGSWDVNYGCISDTENELNKTLSNIDTSGGNNILFGLTEKADVTISFNLSELTYMISTKGMKVGDDAATGYTVSLKDGVKDADKWTVKVGEGQAQALPIGGLKGDGSETVTLQYNGRLKVKGVKATSEAAAPVPVTYTALSGGEVLHVGDIIEIPDGQEWHINNSYIMSSRNPLTVVRANITFDQWDELTVTEAADGAYYVIKDTGGWYYCTYEGYTLPVTGTSDGIYVTYNGILWDEYPDYTFSVHDPAAAAKPAATVTTAPTGAAVVGVGKTTALVSGGVADGGTLMYAVTTTNTKPTSTDDFSGTVPTAQSITASGKVYVWYYVKGDGTHSDSEIAATAIEVTVAQVITWNSSNVSDLRVTYKSYTKEGVTLSANGEWNEARWRNKGEENGIYFEAMETGGYTFTAPNGKKFTKIEMKAQDSIGWDIANLGTGWAINNTTITWTGSAASTVGLLTDAGNFNGKPVNSIVFYLVNAE